MRGWACLFLICHQQKRAFGGWQRSRRRYRNQFMTSTWGHGFRRSWRMCALLQMSLIMLAEKRETSPPIFVFRVTYFCPSWKRPSPCFQYVPTTVLVLIRQQSHMIHVLSAIPHSIRILVKLLSMLVTQQMWYHRLQQAQNLPYNYIPYTVCRLVYSSLYLLSTVLLYTPSYCCTSVCTCYFYLNSGPTTTVGPYIIIEKRKRSLLLTSLIPGGASSKFV